MQTRVYLFLIAALIAVAPCYAGKQVTRDGSTMARAIPLKHRGTKAIQEEMDWMTKLYHYTPLLATRDVVAEAVRKIKAGNKKAGENLHPWEHGTLEHNGQWCSYWSFVTPHGRKEIYFDTGISVNTPGEVARQESSRAEYMARMSKSLQIPGI